MTPCSLAKWADVSDNDFSETSAHLYKRTWSRRPPSTSRLCDSPRLATSQLTWPHPSNSNISLPSVIISLFFFSDLFAFFNFFFMFLFHIYSFSLSSATELYSSIISFLYFISFPISLLTFSCLHFHPSFVQARPWCRGHKLVQSLHAVPRYLPHLYLPREQPLLMLGIPRTVRCYYNRQRYCIYHCPFNSIRKKSRCMRYDKMHMIYLA